MNQSNNIQGQVMNRAIKIKIIDFNECQLFRATSITQKLNNVDLSPGGRKCV